MGASGGGKSSLLRLLTGLMPPTKGKIVIDGIDFTALNTAEKTSLCGDAAFCIKAAHCSVR